jgi:predicted lipoprotein with Yx(FWY)xxD motif
MKLSPDSVKQLKALLQSVSHVKIDKLIIEPNLIRGIDEAQTIVIVTDSNVPDFGDATIGLNRLSALEKRIALFGANEDFNVEAVEAPKRNEDDALNISSIKLSSKGTKFEYRCARTELIKAPKRLNDEMVWAVTITQEAVKTAISAANTMASEQIAIVSKASGEVLFEIVDGETQDTFTTRIADSAEWVGEDDIETQSFVHYYAVKTLMPLLKAAAAAGDPTILVGRDGMAQITVNGYPFTLLPREE